MRITAFFVLLLGLVGCQSGSKAPLFTLLTPEETGIAFANVLTESDSLNPLVHLNLYNGGGTAAGDFNGDGKLDVYFTANAGPNALYLNQENFKFKNVTAPSGTDGQGRWCQGVAVVDVNADGKLDLYVSAGLLNDPEKRRNLLYVNQGNDAGGVPQFKDLAAAYGLDDTTSTTQATFFDYDNDGDLDVYLLVDLVAPNKPTSTYRPKITDGSAPYTDRLYRNDFDAAKGHPVFTDVSQAAGITIEGYGLGVTVCDLNRDGWKDLYVSNDFITNDLLWMNNGDGTFTDRAAEAFKHTSFTAMGNDVVDLNNDGYDEVITMDMMAEDNFRRKQMDRPYSYNLYQLYRQYGYQHQYKRNTLQLNLGPNPQSAAGVPVFSDVAFQTGTAFTDWSWAPLCFDADGDGYRDVLVTNGYYRDLSDNDFIAYRVGNETEKSKLELTKLMPQIKIPNYAFRNRGLPERGALGFEDVSGTWGINQPGFSHSGVYGDFDGDGDLDFIVNNLQEPAFVYRNNAREQTQHHFLRVKLAGPKTNPLGYGTRIEVRTGDRTQHAELTPVRGYLSSQEPVAHFGLGTAARVEEVLVTWPDGTQQRLTNQAADQTLTLNHARAGAGVPPAAPPVPIWQDITAQSGLDYVHEEDDFNDFDYQKLLLHKFSQSGPPLAVGDVDGDGLDDVFVGGSKGRRGVFFLQKPGNRFQQADRLPELAGPEKKEEDTDALLFDADRDGDRDLLVLSSGYEQIPYNPFLAPRLFLNDGRGTFTKAPNAFPTLPLIGSCVRAGDFDGDGDLDLFLGNRVKPNYFPTPVSSFILRNDSPRSEERGVSGPPRGSENEKSFRSRAADRSLLAPRFSNVSDRVAPALKNIGMICDAVWSDVDGDRRIDLVLAGELMPITILKNGGERLEPLPLGTDLDGKRGFWNRLTAADLDGDGDTDYVVGNAGLNTLGQPSAQTPMRFYYGDFNDDGSFDLLPTAYFRTSLDGPEKKEYLLFVRDDLNKQINQFRKRFTDYRSFSEATADELLAEYENKSVAEANYAASVWLENRGRGELVPHELPALAQTAPLYGIVTGDFDGNGRMDLVLSGNDYGNELLSGRQDALSGLFLKGTPGGTFQPRYPAESGLFIPGDAKALVTLKNSAGQTLLVSSENQGRVRVFGSAGRKRIL
jgi:hypothetical protein